MRIILTSLVVGLLFSVCPLSASLVGPDSFGYTARDNGSPGGLPYSWIDILATGTPLVTGDDNVSPSQSFGGSQSFSFYGSSHTNFFATTNGIIGFGTTTSSNSNAALPASAFGPSILAYWDNLYGPVRYEYFPSSPHGSLSGPVSVISWNGAYCCTVGSAVLEVLLEHNTGRILVQYNNTTYTGRSNGASATIGIQADGTGSNFLQYSSDSASVPNSSTLLFAASDVPEPGAWLLTGGGLLLLVLRRRRSA